MAIAVIVEWYGPFSPGTAEATDALGEFDGLKTLYMVVNTDGGFDYIGVTLDAGNEVPHCPALATAESVNFFLGCIESQEISGPVPRNGVPRDLDLAGHALIRFLQPALNQEPASDPDDCVAVSSWFYGPDFMTPVNTPPKFPTLLSYRPESDQYPGDWVTFVAIDEDVPLEDPDDVAVPIVGQGPAGFLTGMRGEHIVSAILSRRGFIVATTPKNAPEADLLISDSTCENVYSIQVKSGKGGSFWLLNKNVRNVVADTHLYVFVRFGDQFARPVPTEYYVVPSSVVARLGRNLDGTFPNIQRADIQEYRDKWELLSGGD